MRSLGWMFLSLAAFAASAPARAAEALPEAGEVKLAAYQFCRVLATLDMGAFGSEGSTECNGVVRNLDNQKAPDNISIHCIEDTSARPQGYKYMGTCIQTDDDGDMLFMTYDEPNGGQMTWIGGTGKYKNVSGIGSLHVMVAPGNTGNQFSYTLTYDVKFTNKPKP